MLSETIRFAAGEPRFTMLEFDENGEPYVAFFFTGNTRENSVTVTIHKQDLGTFGALVDTARKSY